MHSRGLLIGLLALATVVVDLVALVELATQPTHIFRPLLAVLFALVFSQVSLLAIWVGLARRPAPWPLAAAIVAVLTWAVSMGILFKHRHLGTVDWCAGVMLVQLTAVAGGLWIARLAGARLVAAPDGRPIGRADPDRPGQFSIGYMLGWMTALAIVLGLGRWVLSAGVLTIAVSTWLKFDFWPAAAANALIAWPVAWAMLGTRRPILLALAPCLALVLVVGYYCLFDKSPGDHLWISLIYIGQTALLAGSLLVVRIDGYRLVGRSTGFQPVDGQHRQDACATIDGRE